MTFEELAARIFLKSITEDHTFVSRQERQVIFERASEAAVHGAKVFFDAMARQDSAVKIEQPLAVIGQPGAFGPPVIGEVRGKKKG